MEEPSFKENVSLYPEKTVKSELVDDLYELKLSDGRVFQSKTQPLLASGFIEVRVWLSISSKTERMVSLC